LVLAATLFPGSLVAQTNRAKQQPANRYLLIVDTSRPMKRRANATLKLVQELTMSGLNGRLQRGDTLGLWTFNKKLYTGRFPLQTWSMERRAEISARMVAFLKSQKYENTASFDRVQPALTYVVEHSERLLVVLISSGEETIQGTRFDQPINDFYDRLRAQQEKARMPFVTVFSAHRGRMDGYTVNTPPWPLELPAVPQEAPTDYLERRLQQALQKGQTTSAPPWTVSGQKAQAPKAPVPKPEAAPVTGRKPAPTAATSSTNTTPGRLTTSASASSTQLEKTQAAPAVPGVTPTQSVAKPAPAPAPIPEPKAQVVKAAPEEPVQRVVPKPSLASSALAIMPKLPTNAAVRPQLAQRGGSKMATTSAPTPAEPPAVATTTKASTVAITSSNRPSSSSNAPAVAATAAPAGGLASKKMLWAAGGALVILSAAVLVLLRVRRRPPAPQGSLITRSYDRGQKQ